MIIIITKWYNINILFHWPILFWKKTLSHNALYRSVSASDRAKVSKKDTPFRGIYRIQTQKNRGVAFRAFPAFPRDFQLDFPVIGVGWIRTKMLPNTSSILKLLEAGVCSRKSSRRTWIPNQCLQKFEFGGYNEFEICEAPIPDIPLDLFSCQNVHYKAFHCKHELDTWNQQTTAIGTITEVACKKLLWISSQNWKRDVWNFDTKMIL